MAPVIIDGRVRVTFATAIANIAAPTTTELNAGTSLEGFITPDGLDIGFDTGEVDVANIGSTYSSTRAGRRKATISVKFHHDSPTDTPWNLLPYRTTGYLVVRMGIDKTTAWASGDKVKVFPVEAGEPSDEAPGPDSTWDFTVPMFVTADANQRAVVA